MRGRLLVVDATRALVAVGAGVLVGVLAVGGRGAELAFLAGVAGTFALRVLVEFVPALVVGGRDESLAGADLATGALGTVGPELHGVQAREAALVAVVAVGQVAFPVLRDPAGSGVHLRVQLRLEALVDQLALGLRHVRVERTQDALERAAGLDHARLPAHGVGAEHPPRAQDGFELSEY